ncbi:hypothetical protein SHKM778_12380 [Streptomyces sp. KM77-8]|uniref:LPXTG cell wall anchor domain-containing protein n=1 Tax=Streptomyces haneummycinicus TaxID=3074435 RepID=A0AAT9HBQ4_9ACTN
MSSALRPLLTATAAGTLLCALWFVPSANATSVSDGTRADSSPQVTEQTRVMSSTTSASLKTDVGEDVYLADTGSFDSTPYIAGGTTCLLLGAGFVVYSVRRERLEF